MTNAVTLQWQTGKRIRVCKISQHTHPHPHTHTHTPYQMSWNLTAPTWKIFLNSKFDNDVKNVYDITKLF